MSSIRNEEMKDMNRKSELKSGLTDFRYLALPFITILSKIVTTRAEY